MRRTAYDHKLALLLAGAARVFAERGFHQTSMRDLSRATGVSLSGLYYYVSSKDELLWVIQDRTYSALSDAVSRALDEAVTPVERLERFVRAHLAFAAARSAEMRVLAREEDALTGDLATRVAARRASHSRTLDAVLAGIERSYGSPQVARDVAARALYGMMEAVSQRAAVRDPADLEPLASDLCRLFLGGFVGAPAGAQALPA